MDYVVLPRDDAAEAEAGDTLTVGTRVRVKAGFLGAGDEGTITAYGRGVEADALFRQTGDFEILIDNEGPVVEWDHLDMGPLAWFPGQSMVVLEAI